MKTVGKTVIGTLGAVCVGVVLTACGSSSGTSSSAGTPTPSDSASDSSSPTPTASDTGGASSTASPSQSSGAGTTVARCTIGNLTAKIVGGEPGAGQRYATIVLTNTSKSRCTVYGFGGMQLLSSSNSFVATKMVRTSPAPKTITLAPGGAASSVIHWTVVPSSGEPQTGACEPTATRAGVTPPDETRSIDVPWTFGAVCGKGTIQQQPYVAGTGG